MCGCARVSKDVFYNYGVCVEKSGKMDTRPFTVVTHRVEKTNGPLFAKPLPVMVEILTQIKIEIFFKSIILFLPTCGAGPEYVAVCVCVCVEGGGEKLLESHKLGRRLPRSWTP